jgi:hypothetical protein
VRKAIQKSVELAKHKFDKNFPPWDNRDRSILNRAKGGDALALDAIRNNNHNNNNHNRNRNGVLRGPLGPRGPVGQGPRNNVGPCPLWASINGP